MNTIDEKSAQYIQEKMLPHIINATRMNDEPLFTKSDLEEAYRRGYNEGYDNGKIDTNLEKLKELELEEKKLKAMQKADQALMPFAEAQLDMINEILK